MHEVIVNLHMHTPYSDGHGTHADIAVAAIEAGLDVVIVTDHNVWVDGPEGYYRNGNRRVLLLVGEEVHDQDRNPQKNHLLVFGADQGMAPLASDPQQLIDGVQKAEGLSFLAHPHEDPAPAIGEGDLSWVDWNVEGFTGLELWNGLSELKSRIRNRLLAFFYVYFPSRIARGPHPRTLEKWDELTSTGRQVVAIGGSDAHALPVQAGPLRRTVFPYGFHFRAINTHLILPRPLVGDLEPDRKQVIDALRKGHAFIGYDLPAPTRGFRFTAQGKDRRAWMGDKIQAEKGVTLQIRLPQRKECRLLKDGQVLKVWRRRETCTHITTEPGVYRVEVFTQFLGRKRGWIYSNPIYLH